jgi:hypothetical protein
MRTWLGVLGRAFIEFFLILLLLSTAVGAMLSLDTGIHNLLAYMAGSSLNLVPLAVSLTLFLAFFDFELKIRSRIAGWFGLMLLGGLLMAGGIQARRMDFIKESLPVPVAAVKAPTPSPAGVAATKGGVALWYRAAASGDLLDAVAVDFGSDFPRMAYSARSFFDPSSGLAEIGGRSYDLTRPAPQSVRLVPEASVFAGAWIWDRLAAMDREPLLDALAAAGGFILLALGFRFLCRISGWPLANAVLAAAGFVGIVVLDAVLSGSVPQKAILGLAKDLGLNLPPVLLLAALEGGAGLLLGLVDLAAAPRRGADGDE